MAPHHCVAITALVFLLGGAAMLTAGLATTAWTTVTDVDKNNYNIGLFTLCVSTKGVSVCKDFKCSEIFPTDKYVNCKDYEVVKGTSITGVMLTFIATVLLLVFLTCKKSRAFASLVFIIAGLGGALGIIQVITYSKIQKGYADDPYFRDTDYGYSFIVGTMGGIMTCLAAILTLVSCCKFSSTSDDEAMLKIDVPGVTSPQGYGNAAQPNSSWA